jgi:predicted nucleic acid-binding protein
LCLDLNVWVSAQLANVEKHRNTAAQTLVQVAELGRCALGPTQIVISWGMLTRLRSVFERKLQTGRTDIDVEIQQIATLASLGPAENAPYVLLGGTGVMPLHDEEDAHVLETAVAGDAHVLATANFDDFIWYRSEIVKPGRIAIHEGPRQPLVIAHPFEVVRWTREGRITFD